MMIAIIIPPGLLFRGLRLFRSPIARTAASRGGAQICFAAGTLVATEEGLQPIEEIGVGDRVWARDDETGEEGWKPVTEVFVTPDREMLELTFEAADGTTQMLRVTAEHPLWSLDDVEWDSAGNLDIGEHVDALHGTMRLISVAASHSTETVFNFEVATSHTYFVGDAGIWVHNSCKALDAAKAAQDVLAGSLKRKFPGQHLDKSLNQIKEALKTATGAEKKSLQTAKKLLEHQGRLLQKVK